LNEEDILLLLTQPYRKKIVRPHSKCTFIVKKYTASSNNKHNLQRKSLILFKLHSVDV